MTEEEFNVWNRSINIVFGIRCLVTAMLNKQPEDFVIGKNNPMNKEELKAQFNELFKDLFINNQHLLSILKEKE